jgi:hypothetical protein
MKPSTILDAAATARNVAHPHGTESTYGAMLVQPSREELITDARAPVAQLKEETVK